MFFGLFQVPFLHDVWFNFVQFLCHVGVILESFWGHFGALGGHLGPGAPQGSPKGDPGRPKGLPREPCRKIDEKVTWRNPARDSVWGHLGTQLGEKSEKIVAKTTLKNIARKVLQKMSPGTL